MTDWERMALFHVTTRSAWTAALASGSYHPPSLDTEGFIHFSGDKQWLTSANRFFRGQAGLVLLVVRADRLCARLVYESADGEQFPHLYGELNVDAVTDVFELPLAPDGSIRLPAELAGWASYFVSGRRI
jgi:uncharacterized protein (DUF952 family)